MTLNVILFAVSCDTPDIEKKPHLRNASNSSEQLMFFKLTIHFMKD